MRDARFTGRSACAGCGGEYRDEFEQIAASGVCLCCDGADFAHRADWTGTNDADNAALADLVSCPSA